MEEFKGRIAFWPVIAHPDRERDAWGLGVVEEDDPGYRPYEGLSFDSQPHAQAAADELNGRLGLSKEEAHAIVTSSMRAQNQQPRRRARRG